MVELTGARAMLASGVDDGLVAMDLVDLLQQDGQPGEAIAVYEKAALREPPEYALLAATHAYRDVQRTGDAERLARKGAARFPARLLEDRERLVGFAGIAQHQRPRGLCRLARALADQARRAGMGEATLAAARDMKIVVVHVDG
jgi:hypothetical protein